MKKIETKVIESIGLRVRQASILVSTASQFKSKIKIKVRDSRVGNLKSIMSVLVLRIRENDKLEITADGPDEDKAIKAIERILKEKKIIE